MTLTDRERRRLLRQVKIDAATAIEELSLPESEPEDDDPEMEDSL